MRNDRSGAPRRRGRYDSTRGPAQRGSTRPRAGDRRGRAGDRERAGDRDRAGARGRAGPRRPEKTQHPERATAIAGKRDGRRTSRARSSEAWDDARDSAGSFKASSLVRHAEWASLVPALERAGADVEATLPRLAEYVGSVLSWNRTVSNLISRGDEARLVSRHLAESLEPAAWLAESGARRWIDLGSGAGFPALPIAIAGVGNNWLLVESRRPKTLFLRRVIGQLCLSNVFVVHSRLEDLLHRAALGQRDPDLARAGGVPFDALTSRATMRLAPTLDLAAASVRSGGHAFLWKGSARGTEKASAEDWSERWRDDGERVLESGQTAVCRFLLLK